MVTLPPRGTTKLPCGNPFIWIPPGYWSPAGTEKVIVSPDVTVTVAGEKVPPDPHVEPLSFPSTAVVAADVDAGRMAASDKTNTNNESFSRFCLLIC